MKRFIKSANFKFLVSIILISLLGYSQYLFADDGIASVANNVSTVFEGGRQLINFSCYVLGIILIISAIIRYSRHRQNPIEVPINIPIVLLILGILLVLLPSTHELSLYFSAKTGMANTQQ